MNTESNDNPLFAFPYDNLPSSLTPSMDFDFKKMLEALLLSTAEPITVKEVVGIFARYRQDLETAAEAMGEDESDEALPRTDGPTRVTQAHIREALSELTDAAEAEDKAYRVVEGPSGFRIVTAPRFAEFVRLLRGEPRPMKLSPAALETISIVAYRQPVTRAEVEAIRGVSVDHALNRLIELELVRVMGRAELPGRPIQYGTTEKFLEFTGIKELDELPASDVLSRYQIDDWMRRGEKPEEAITDEDVGLSRELEPDELPPDETCVEVDWQKENVESDAAAPSGDELEENPS